jgi:class 3 adenylate cyclase
MPLEPPSRGQRIAAAAAYQEQDGVEMMTAGQPGTKEGQTGTVPRPFFSLRFVIAAYCALIVLLVASTTFAITYSVAMATLDATSRRYATALMDAGRIRVGDFFAVPAKQATAMARALSQPFSRFPSDDEDNFTVTERAADFLVTTILFDPSAVLVGFVLYDDGSAVTARFISPTQLEVSMTNGRTLPPRSENAKCCAFGYSDVYNYPEMNTLARNRTYYDNYADSRLDLYTTIKSLIQGANFGIWQPPVYFDDTEPAVYAMPAIHPFRNSTHYLGVVASMTSLSNISSFLTQLTTTENSEVFAIDENAAIVGSTHAIPFVSSESTTRTTLKPGQGPNCAHSGATTGVDSTFTIVCRALVTEFPWVPLQAAAAIPEVSEPEIDQVYVGDFSADGDDYFVAATGIANDFRLFTFNLILIMPAADVNGDVVKARTLVIIVVVLIFLVACGVSVTVTGIVLSPLKSVSRKMRYTANLREERHTGFEREGMSRLGEIHDLQSAYRNMDVAIRSFSRYVPRDVVKDLMKSGMLCEIRMQNYRCTILFVDIAGFTTICERVTTDELADLIKAYFEHMSAIVMNHDGLIDKFIGDCIMAVWGAPIIIANQEVKASLSGLLIDRETRVAPLRDQFDRAGEVLSVRVGIATGTVLAGNMGSTDRMSYTVIGDDVNLAARLESMNKQMGTRVMVAGATAQRLWNFFVLRQLMRVAVVGKSEPVDVFEVVGLKDPRTVPPDGLAELRAADALAREQDGDDLNSTYSVRSVDGPGNLVTIERTHDQLSTVALLEKASTFTDEPLVVDEAGAQEAARFTKAVRAFVSGHFDQCLALLTEIEGRAAAEQAVAERDAVSSRMSATSVAGGKVFSIVRSTAQQFLSTGAPPDFNGVWTAVEK